MDGDGDRKLGSWKSEREVGVGKDGAREERKRDLEVMGGEEREK